MAKSLTQGIEGSLKELRRVKANLTLSFQDTLMDVGESLIFYTPLKTGLASSNWNMTDSTTVSSQRQPEGGTKGAAAISAMQSQVTSIDIGGITTFYNPVDYIDDLERGTSTQAPAGMITPTKVDIQSQWLRNLYKYNLI